MLRGFCSRDLAAATTRPHDPHEIADLRLVRRGRPFEAADARSDEVDVKVGRRTLNDRLRRPQIARVASEGQRTPDGRCKSTPNLGLLEAARPARAAGTSSCFHPRTSKDRGATTTSRPTGSRISYGVPAGLRFPLPDDRRPGPTIGARELLGRHESGCAQADDPLGRASPKRARDVALARVRARKGAAMAAETLQVIELAEPHFRIVVSGDETPRCAAEEAAASPAAAARPARPGRLDLGDLQPRLPLPLLRGHNEVEKPATEGR